MALPFPVFFCLLAICQAVPRRYDQGNDLPNAESEVRYADLASAMELNWLEDFLALAEHLNFSRAAEARNVTQPAFSRRIRALENWVGTPLVLRSPQGVTLNAAGEYLRDQAGGLVRNHYQMRRGALALAGREGSALSIAATHALSFTFFPGWIRAHAPLETLGTLNLISDSMAACERILLGGDADFLLCHHHRDAPTRFAPDAFTDIVVGRDELVPLATPDPTGAPSWQLPTVGAKRRSAYWPIAPPLGSAASWRRRRKSTD